MDKIEIKNLEIFANHGVFPEENILGQKFFGKRLPASGESRGAPVDRHF